MEDEEIVALYWQREESAIGETEHKYGVYLRKIAYNLLASTICFRAKWNNTFAESGAEDITWDGYMRSRPPGSWWTRRAASPRPAL